MLGWLRVSGFALIESVELPLLHPKDAIATDETSRERVQEEYQES